MQSKAFDCTDLVEKQNEVQCEGNKESQETQVVEITRQIVLEAKKVGQLIGAV